MLHSSSFILLNLQSIMIIFGWGRNTIRKFGPAIFKLCSNCNNERFWELISVTTWFTLFFIPVIPYKKEWFCSCPVCDRGVSILPEQIDKLKRLSNSNQRLISGEITADEYKAELDGSATGDSPVNKNSFLDEYEAYIGPAIIAVLVISGIVLIYGG